MTLSVKNSGAWRTITGLYVKASGVWRTATNGYIKSGGVWREFFTSAINVTVSTNQTNFNLYTAAVAAGYDGTSAVTIICTINSGIVINASGTGTPAFTFGSIPGTCTVEIINLGTIEGAGGAGGKGGDPTTPGGTGPATPGNNAGNAMNITCPTTITNGSGYIWGGGGGGGGGAELDITVGKINRTAGGGGGGGGAGNAVGAGGAGVDGGASGSAGTNSAGGAGGAGGTDGAYSAGAGGAGGNPGVDGNTGGGPGAAGGAAGKAINLNGNSVTWVSGSTDPNVKGVVS